MSDPFEQDDATAPTGETSVLTTLTNEMFGPEDGADDAPAPEKQVDVFEGEDDGADEGEGEDGQKAEEGVQDSPQGDAAPEATSVPMEKYELLLKKYEEALGGKVAETPADAQAEPVAETTEAEVPPVPQALRGEYRPFKADFIGKERYDALASKHGDDIIEALSDMLDVYLPIMHEDGVRLSMQNAPSQGLDPNQLRSGIQSEIAYSMFIRENPQWRGKDAIVRAGLREVAKANRGVDPVDLMGKLADHLDQTFYDTAEMAKAKAKKDTSKPTPRNTTTNTVAGRNAAPAKMTQEERLIAGAMNYNQQNRYVDIY
jgi:hypothetical protein